MRTTIEKESRGAQVKKIERKKKNGKYVYELEVIKGGQQLEIKIAEDGSVLKRKVEKDGED